MDILRNQIENRVLSLLDRRIIGDYPDVTVGEMEVRDESDDYPSGWPVRYHYPVTVEVDGVERKAAIVVSVEVEG